MITVFQTPQFDLLPDASGIRYYGNVSNKMEVYSSMGGTYYVAVAVPTGLFTLMKDVFGIKPEQKMFLSLDLVNGYYLFSLLSDKELYDLWFYTERGLPVWIKNPKYRV